MTLTKKIMIKILNLKIGDIVRISIYKNIFAKGYVPIWSEEVFMIKNVKNTNVISDIKGEEIVGTFYKKELKKRQIKRSLELKK